jgi:hypothetical protein
MEQFINSDNLHLLWEVLLDELNINTENKSLISNIRLVFESNLKLFTAKINPNTNIINLNKQFLSQLLVAVNKLFPSLKNESNIKRINITNEEILEPYKIEDIHSARKSDFEKELERKKMELENYMTPVKPKELDFSFRNLDDKIPSGGMDSLLADKMAERNFDIENIQQSNYNLSNINPENWLKAKETSISSEKIEQRQIEQISNINKNSKKVSWNENVDSNISLKIEETNTIDIFQKLKKNNIDNNSESKYLTQNSNPLPKQEEVPKNESNFLKPQINQNIPIIPNTEIIKQLNQMNDKIDNLYEIISKLTNCFSKNDINNININ